ncbi:unnamed protein product [Cyclocybe aegerita]|uniref:Succinate dehydrogenase assembly factor 2, mitochondrial n=1 Tax=Cyclocybe aegerita TaxID=1973307 RepID=A0A8S0X1M4_CYCAE|nr:unnamed protein product [Cyclocybe aegerita]
MPGAGRSADETSSLRGSIRSLAVRTRSSFSPSPSISVQSPDDSNRDIEMNAFNNDAAPTSNRLLAVPNRSASTPGAQVDQRAEATDSETFQFTRLYIQSHIQAVRPSRISTQSNTEFMLRRLGGSSGVLAGRFFRPQSFFSSAAPRFADPWPLPHTPEHVASTVTPSDSNPIPPLPRHNESVDTLRARLVYQSRKRGTLESDLLLSTFAKDHLPSMSEEELKEYDKLLDEADWDIYYWATGKRTPSQRWADSPLLETLRVHARNEGKVVRKMPPL